MCKFSLEEAQLLSDREELEKACEVLHQIGTKAIVITLGSEGTFLSTASGQGVIPSIPVSAVDTTGAGDAFIGCLLYLLSSLEHPEKATDNYDLLAEMVRTSNAAGALTTTHFGAIPSLPDQAQLKASLK